MPRANTKTEPRYMQATDSFSGDMEAKDGTMVPVTVTPSRILLEDDPIVQKWPHHFQPLSPARQRPAVEQTTAAPGERRG